MPEKGSKRIFPIFGMKKEQTIIYNFTIDTEVWKTRYSRVRNSRPPPLINFQDFFAPGNSYSNPPANIFIGVSSPIIDIFVLFAYFFQSGSSYSNSQKHDSNKNKQAGSGPAWLTAWLLSCLSAKLLKCWVAWVPSCLSEKWLECWGVAGSFIAWTLSFVHVCRRPNLKKLKKTFFSNIDGSQIKKSSWLVN